MKIYSALLTALLGAAGLVAWAALSTERGGDAPGDSRAPAPAPTPERPAPPPLVRAAPGPEREAMAGGPEEAASESVAKETPAATKEPDGWILFGRLVSESGALLPELGGRIQLVDSDGERHDTVAEGGIYRIEGLSPGRWWVTPKISGWRGETREIVLPRGPARRELNLVVRSLPMIRVEAYARDGSPLTSALTRLGIPIPRPLAAVATLDAPDKTVDLARQVGRFRPASGASTAAGHLGDIDIDIDAPLAVFVSLTLYEIVLATVEVPAGLSRARFEIDPGRLASFLTTVRFEVRETYTGRPVTGCMVLLTKGRSSTVHMLEEEDEGRFEQPDWPIGRLQLRLVGEDYEEYLLDYELEARPVNDLGILLLSPATKLSGHIVVPSALGGEEPSLEEALISFERVSEGPEEESNVILGRRCEEDGAFEVSLGPGRYRIWASLPWGEEELRSVQLYLDTEHDRLTGVRIELLRQAELLIRPDPTVPDGAWIVIRDGNGHRWARRQVQGGIPLRMSLPPDSYNLTVESEEGEILGTLPLELEWPGLDLGLGL